MRLRNAFRIATDNFSNVYKQLLYRLITGIIFFSLTYVILWYGLRMITGSAEMDRLRALVGDFIPNLFTGNADWLTSFRTEFPAALKDLGTLISRYGGDVAGSVVGVCLMYLVARFCDGLSVFAVASSVNDRMSSCSRTRFATAYFRNLGKAALYELVYVPVSFVYDVASLALCWLLFFYTPSLFSSLGVFTVTLSLCLTLTAFVCLEALKMTLVSAWMPSMIAGGEGVRKGLRTSFRSVGGFAGRFSDFLVAIYLIVAVNIALGVFTFGSGLLLSVPFSFLLLACLQFVCYFEDNDRKYYIGSRKIAEREDTDIG